MSKLTRKAMVVLVGLIAGVCAACGGSTSTPEQAPPPQPTLAPTLSLEEIQSLVAATMAAEAAASAPAPTDSEPPAPTPDLLQSFEELVVWIRPFGSSVTDSISESAVDSFGNIYIIAVLGADQPGGSGITNTLRKYNVEGELLWERIMEPARGGFAAQSVTVDEAGNVYVGGQTGRTVMEILGLGDPQEHSFVRKVDGAGNEIWTQILPLSPSTQVSGMAADAEGSIYVVGRAGFTPEDGGEERKAESFLRKYSTTGEVLWTRLLGPGVNGLTLKVVVGIDGNVNVAGSVKGALPGETGGGGWDIYVRTYTPMGEEIWTHQFGSGENEFIEDAAVDGAGNIYVAFNKGDFPMLSKHDASGKQLWTRQLDSRRTRLMRLAIDPEGILYVLMNRSSFPTDADVRKLDTMGDEVWSLVFPSSWPAVPDLIATDKFGSLYVGGSTSGSLPGHAESYERAGDVFLLKMEL